MPFHVLIWWLPRGASQEAFFHIYASDTTYLAGPQAGQVSSVRAQSVAALVFVSTSDNDCITKSVLLTLNILKRESEENGI